MECTAESCNIERRGAVCSCISEQTCEQCCGNECGQSTDPIEHAKMEWHRAFFDALHQAHVDRLRKRIESTWGASMDKAADATIESFGKYWQGMMAQAEAKREFDENLRKIFSEASK